MGETTMLKFSEQNAKTRHLVAIPELAKYLAGKRKIYSFDLLAGWTCPGARDCMAKVHIENGKRRLVDGPHTQFRCFAASLEVAYPNVYNSHKFNTDILKGIRTDKKIAEMILASLPKRAGIIRYEVSGDFFKLAYLKGAILAAKQRPDVLFYAYTKSIPYFLQIDMDDPSNGVVMPNFMVTASYGGKYDHLIPQSRMRTAQVVFSESEAGDLPIDHDDSHAATMGGNFALLLHGVQPAGSPAAKALVQLRGKGSYSR
jgi:hypothetical protein